MRQHVVAVTFGDVHLRAKRPRCRGDNWEDVMVRTLTEVCAIGHEHGCSMFVCSGDIFHRWNTPPEIINLAIRCMPKCYAVPGQHDLPWHNYDLIKKSAYWTLVEAGVVTNLEPGWGHEVGQGKNHITLAGFPWGFDITPPDEAGDITLAVVHDYCWEKGRSFPGAPKEKGVTNHKRKLKPYTAAVFGDNHKGFLAGNVLNGGALIRCSSDEVDPPCVGLLWSDGTWSRQELECAKDDVIIEAPRQGQRLQLEKNLGIIEDLPDFQSLVKRMAVQQEANKNVRSYLMEAMK